MKSTMTALGLVIAAGTLAVSAPANAQDKAPAAEQAKEQPKLKISRGASKALSELQTAVKANDVANIPAKLAAAQAAAKTPDDRYAVGALQYEAAKASGNKAAEAAALEAIIASGHLSPAEMGQFSVNTAAAYRAANQPDRAAAVLEKAIAADPNNIDATVMLAETRNAQGRSDEAVRLLEKAIADRSQGGQKADESWYKRVVSLAYKSKLPGTTALARGWVQAYPTPANWHDAIAIYRNLNNVDDQMLLDMLRVQRAAGALSGESDFHKYAYLAATKGFPAEAKAALEEGFAAGKIDRNKSIFRDTLADITPKAAADKAAIASAGAKGLAAANAKIALANGDLLYGAGDYAKAAEVYRAALGKSGADANLINLHLGAALARSGDKAGATAALNAVTGPNAEIAKFWLVYLATH